MPDPKVPQWFNPYSFNKPKPSSTRPYLFDIQKRRFSQYNKKYKTLPNNIDTKDKVKNYIKKIIKAEYDSKYLFVTPIYRGFPVSKFIISTTHKFNNQKLLYSDETSLSKLLIKEIGKTFFENLDPKQNLFVVDIKFFVKHSGRTLQDKFNEFCVC